MTDIVLLDGGMGQELFHRAGDRPTPLWSTQVMVEHPGLVSEVHRSFCDAGATIATTNTYAVHDDRLAGTQLEGQLETLIGRAQTEAEDAVAAVAGCRIAGSIGPLVASYRPDLHPAHDDAVPLYQRNARLLADWVDLILCETVVSVAHARAILEGAAAAKKPVWLAVSVDDEDGSLLRSGEPVADILALNGYDALLANCSAPEAIPAALAELSASDVPYGGYANGFTQITKDFLTDKPTVDALEKRRDFSPEVYADHVMAWVAAGATIVGGCCEVGPAHIQAIAGRILGAGHNIV